MDCRVLMKLQMAWFVALAAALVWAAPCRAAMDDAARARGHVTMTLADCLATALEQNPDVAIQRIDTDNAIRSIRVERAAFDPDFSAGFSYGDSRRPSSSTVTGNRRKTTQFQSGYQGLRRNGDVYDLTLTQVKADTDSTFSTLNPSYTMDLILSYTRPLKQGRGRDVTLTGLRISQLNSEISELQFQSEIMDLAADVEEAYWALVYARENVAVKQDTLSLSQETLTRTQDMIEAGAMAASEALLVQAQVAQREQELIAARGDLEAAGYALKLVMHVSPGTALWASEITPGGPGVEVPQFAARAFDDALATALARRPDFLGAQKGLAVSRVRTVTARDQARPAVDLQTSLGLGGLSGNYTNSVQDITSAQYPSWQVGVFLDVPMRRRRAKALLEQSLDNERKAGLEIDKAQQGIAVELARAQVALNTAEQSVAAARVTTQYADQKYREAGEKHVLGIATTHDVLEYQNDLAVARLNEARAAIDYNRAVAEYYYVTGTLLDEKNIRIQGSELKIGQ